jgi:hypothetical protein
MVQGDPHDGISRSFEDGCRQHKEKNFHELMVSEPGRQYKAAVHGKKRPV